MKRIINNYIIAGLAAVTLISSNAWAKDVEYKNTELTIHVAPGEPTEVQFPGKISGGFKKKQSALSIDRKDESLILFSGDGITFQGEAIIVRLNDGRSYSLRIARATTDSPRDPVVKILDNRGSISSADDEETPAYKEKNFEYAPPTQVSGLMREMMLAAEFGKSKISGYQESDRFKGQVVLNDGTIVATVDRIFIGPNLWGYVLDAKNMLDATQKINPASFRLDGTRAVSMRNWELAPRPMNAEQQLAARDSTKVYIITKAKAVK